MSEQYHVNTEGLAGAVADLAAFEEHAEEVIAEAEQLAAAYKHLWAGTAADEYQEAHALWAKEAAEMRAALARVRQSGANAHGNYTAAIAANSGFWK
ncbi:MAG: WXG100 family type VII secretion target [Segniliparus sp.]|uniref:WXG100 family type VII secretion target n=1 Tax=Segniliparus sp. TaxID=2804064 RepID=UPI003F37447C